MNCNLRRSIIWAPFLFVLNPLLYLILFCYIYLMKRLLYILNGGEGNDFSVLTESFESSEEYECCILDCLYKAPEKLVELKVDH